MYQFLISVGIDEIFDGSVKVEYIVENTQYLTIRSFLQTVKITLMGLSVNFCHYPWKNASFVLILGTSKEQLKILQIECSV